MAKRLRRNALTETVGAPSVAYTPDRRYKITPYKLVTRRMVRCTRLVYQQAKRDLRGHR